MKNQIVKDKPASKKDILLSHNTNIRKETNSSFWEKLFFGPHKIEGEEIDEAEDQEVMQQLIWWSRME
jgi:hypothetical protein